MVQCCMCIEEQTHWILVSQYTILPNSKLWSKSIFTFHTYVLLNSVTLISDDYSTRPQINQIMCFDINLFNSFDERTHTTTYV